MSASNISAQDTTDNPFAYLYTHQYMQLVTFRKDGTGVPTPVWFAPNQGKLYVLTVRNVGKVKRIHNNGRVTLAPCNQTGKVLGAKIEAYARELPESEYQRAITTLQGKYGFLYRVFTFFQNFRKITRTYIEIEPV